MASYEELQWRASNHHIRFDRVTVSATGENIYNFHDAQGNYIGSSRTLKDAEGALSNMIKEASHHPGVQKTERKREKKSASHKVAKRMLIRNGKPNYTAEKEWARLSRAEQLQAYHETGSFVEPKGRTLQDMGGSTADVLFDWTKRHKKEYPNGY